MVWDATLPQVNTQLVSSPAIFQTNQASMAGVVTTTNLVNLTPYIPTSAPMYIYSDTVPTGWTLQAAVKDCLLALKDSSVTDYATGGVMGGAWTTGGYQIVSQDLPRFTGPGPSNVVTVIGALATIGNAHLHTWTTTRPKAAVGILCTKNA